MGRKTCESKYICKRYVKFSKTIKMDEDSTFLKYLDIGDSDPRKHKKGFGGADDIADWFKNDKRSDDWRQRD